MKHNETSSDFKPIKGKTKNRFDDFEDDEDGIGERHIATSVDTPLKPDAFDMDDEDKIEAIRHKFAEIMDILGLDLTDESLKGTPLRVAKMYVNEIFSGLNPENKPVATLFENKFGYSEMLLEKDITFYTCCEHHFVPFFGRAHVAYYSSGNVIGLSKLNRIVQYYAQRPQVQERLTQQVGKELQDILDTEDVAIIMEAQHLCVSSRGIKDVNSSTTTAFYGGKFREESTKAEFLGLLGKR